MEDILLVILASISPISELRGGIPLGLTLGLPLEIVLITAIIFNCLVFFPVFFGLELLYEKFFSKRKWVWDIMERIHKKGSKYVEKYEVLGLAIFVGIPLPFTGVWTGSALAWLLDLDWKKSFLAVSLGVIIAACIVTAAYFFFITLVNAVSLMIAIAIMIALLYAVYIKSKKRF